MSLIAFFDLEISLERNAILDMGAIRSDEAEFHQNNPSQFLNFINKAIIAHDLKYLQKYKGQQNFGLERAIDTLLLSPLLFPEKPYHRLLKDDKLQTEELNNPLNDSKKTRDLFYDEVNAFNQLPENIKSILYGLIGQSIGFASFFKFLKYSHSSNVIEIENDIRVTFHNKICERADINYFIKEYPEALAYALALINSNDRYSITPLGLKRYFGFSKFRTYNDEPLQENAINAAIQGKSLLAVFPTVGGNKIYNYLTY